MSIFNLNFLQLVVDLQNKIHVTMLVCFMPSASLRLGLIQTQQYNNGKTCNFNLNWLQISVRI